MALQGALNAAGADLVVDGVMGQSTAAAIRQFEADNRMPQTGRPSAALFRALADGKTFSQIEVGRTEVDGLRGRVRRLVRETMADDHRVDNGLDFERGRDVGDARIGLSVEANAELNTRVALKGTDAFRDLVASDRRRLEHVQQHAKVTWAQTRLALSASAGASVQLPSGAASVGFSVKRGSELELTSITAHEVQGIRDVKRAVAVQAKSMVVPVTAESLRAAQLAPGSEWMLRGEVSTTIGLNAQVGEKVDEGFGAEAGVNARRSVTDFYTKNIKVLGDDQVFVQISKQDSRALRASVSAEAGMHFGDFGDPATDWLRRETEQRLSATTSAWATRKAGTHSLGSAVLDLSTRAGRAAYDRLLRLPPDQAAQYIRENGLGHQLRERSRAAESGAKIELFDELLLSLKTLRSTTRGVTVTSSGERTHLHQASHRREVEGLLPKWIGGQERTVGIFSGEVRRGGQRAQGVGISLEVDEKSLSRDENDELQRFGQLMGAPIQGMPHGALGRVEHRTHVSLTDDGVARLGRVTGEQLRAVYGHVLGELQGKAPPMWATDRRRFERVLAEYRRQNVSERARMKYLEGRNLKADIESYEAANAIARELEVYRGKPAAEWGPLLSAIGSQGATDVRAAMVVLHRMAGAELTKMEVQDGGQRYRSEVARLAPVTMAEVVGSIMDAPR